MFPSSWPKGTAAGNLINPEWILLGGDRHTNLGLGAIQARKCVYLNWVEESKDITTKTWYSTFERLSRSTPVAGASSSKMLREDLRFVTIPIKVN